VIALLLPSLNRLMAGYQDGSLRQERQRLELDRAALELQESKLLSPARLERAGPHAALRRSGARSVVYLENKSGSNPGKEVSGLAEVTVSDDRWIPWRQNGFTCWPAWPLSGPR
jgi:hypothetical protein